MTEEKTIWLTVAAVAFAGLHVFTIGSLVGTKHQVEKNASDIDVMWPRLTEAWTHARHNRDADDRAACK